MLLRVLPALRRGKSCKPFKIFETEVIDRVSASFGTLAPAGILCISYRSCLASSRRASRQTNLNIKDPSILLNSESGRGWRRIISLPGGCRPPFHLLGE